MKKNVTYSIGNIALIDKANEYLGDEFFETLFEPIAGKTKDFIPKIKLFIYNRLGHCVSINRFEDYPEELFDALDFEEKPMTRGIYRTLERVGENYPFILKQYQDILKKYGLLTDKHFIDFSSTYFEGKMAKLGKLGYTRDGQPGKKQITFGISIEENTIPSAITIQKGNVCDKKHFNVMLKTASAILNEDDFVIFDCGANTKASKKKVREKKLNYLTLKQKKVSPYKKAIDYFNSQEKTVFEFNEIKYECVKKKNNDEFQYIFFSEELKKEQFTLKERKFQKELKKNQPLLNKTKKGKPLCEYYTEEGIIIAEGALQTTLDEVQNPYIKGLEGFFILESSADMRPKEILALYKDKDKSEKLIRNIKEGLDLHPMRVWSTDAIRGFVLLVFLTIFLVNLTLLKAKNPLVKNVKVLKNYLMNLTVTVVYIPGKFRFHILSNVSDEILSILGDFIYKYEDKTLPLRW